MARQLRFEFSGAHYHVMARGNHGEKIFADDKDRGGFLTTLGEAAERCGWRVHAWVLMENHYHLLLETPEPNLVTGMKWLQHTYTQRFNGRHQQWGHLFAGRYKAIVVQQPGLEGDSMKYYVSLLDYIHLNPVRALLVKKRESLLAYRWSSLAQGYAVSSTKRQRWMEVSGGLASCQCRDDAVGRRKYVERLEKIRLSEEACRCGQATLDGQSLNSRLERGWYWGGESFKGKMLGLLEKQKPVTGTDYRYSSEVAAHGEARACELVEAGLKYHGLSKEDLPQLKGGDKRKVEIAYEVFKRTSVSQSWLAEELNMQSRQNVSQVLGRWKKGGRKDKAKWV